MNKFGMESAQNAGNHAQSVAEQKLLEKSEFNFNANLGARSAVANAGLQARVDANVQTKVTEQHYKASSRLIEADIAAGKYNASLQSKHGGIQGRTAASAAATQSVWDDFHSGVQVAARNGHFSSGANSFDVSQASISDPYNPYKGRTFFGSVVDPALAVASNIVVTPLSGLLGLAAGGDAGFAEYIQQEWAYTPRTEEAYITLNGMNEAMQPIANGMAYVSEGLGDAAYELTGSAGLATAFYTLPEAALAILAPQARGALMSVSKGAYNGGKNTLRAIGENAFNGPGPIASQRGSLDVGAFVPDKLTTAQRIEKLDLEGHAPIRHGGPKRVTGQQLEDRALRGIDPASGTPFDAFNKYVDGSPKPHKVGRHASAFASDKALLHADDFARNSTQFQQNIAAARASGDMFVDAVDLPLSDVFGSSYQNSVRGVTRLGSKRNPTGHVPTDFTDGMSRAIYRLDQSGNAKLHTLYPIVKP